MGLSTADACLRFLARPAARKNRADTTYPTVTTVGKRVLGHPLVYYGMVSGAPLQPEMDMLSIDGHRRGMSYRQPSACYRCEPVWDAGRGAMLRSFCAAFSAAISAGVFAAGFFLAAAWMSAWVGGLGTGL
jgi:hypothetical protein